VAERGPEGYRDWQRVSNMDGPTIYTVPLKTLAGELSSARFAVSRYLALLIVGRAVSEGNFRVKIDWYESEGAAEPLASRVFVVANEITHEFVGTIPNLGPWVAFFLEATKSRLRLQVLASNRLTHLEVLSAVPVPMVFAEKIVAKGTKTVYPEYYCAGPARVRFNAGLGGEVAIEALVGVDTWVIIDAFAGTEAAPKQEQAVILPATAWRATVTSTAAAEAEMKVAVVPSPTGSS
jgi:hypothetical protein